MVKSVITKKVASEVTRKRNDFEIKAPTILSDEKINSLLDKRSELAGKIQALQAAMELCEDEIKEFMEYQNMLEYQTNRYQIYYKYKTDNRFQKKMLIDEFGEDFYNSYTKPVTSRPFRVTPIKKVKVKGA